MRLPVESWASALTTTDFLTFLAVTVIVTLVVIGAISRAQSTVITRVDAVGLRVESLVADIDADNMKLKELRREIEESARGWTSFHRQVDHQFLQVDREFLVLRQDLAQIDEHISDLSARLNPQNVESSAA